MTGRTTAKHIPRKRFGQNFLVDAGVIDDIVSAVAPRHGDSVVEIGPGLGALTQPLLERLDKLHVIEIDRDLIAQLHRRNNADKLIIHEGDVLQFDFADLPQDLRVVGNLPYNISTPLLFRLAEFAGRIRDIHVMLQKEVVERMAASPGDSAFSRLSVMLQYRFDMEILLDVPATSFDPAPKVESAVIRLTPLTPLPHPARNEAMFGSIVARAFSQRRKTLRNTLKGVLADADFARLDIDPSARAQELSVADFVRMADAVTPD